MKRLSYRQQRTIARAVEVQGVGFLTGASIRMRYEPAPPSSGVVFVRTDLDPEVQVPARIDLVSGTQRRTVLGLPPAQVGLVEHVLAALAGLRIDNITVELDGPEPPGLDGSAQGFVDLLHQAGSVLQPARRDVWTVDRPVVVEHNGATLALYPADKDELKVSYLIEYGLRSAVGRQQRTQIVTPERFAAEVAGSRTYIFESEAAELRRQGLGARTTTSDLLVFGRQGPIDNRLRWADEPARHKILDLLGDLSLFGQDIRGHLVAYRSGHALNVELVRVLTRQLSEACGALPAAA